MARDAKDKRLLHYRSETTGVLPLASDLERAELFVNLPDKELWTKDENDSLTQLNANIFFWTQAHADRGKYEPSVGLGGIDGFTTHGSMVSYESVIYVANSSETKGSAVDLTQPPGTTADWLRLTSKEFKTHFTHLFDSSGVINPDIATAVSDGYLSVDDPISWVSYYPHTDYDNDEPRGGGKGALVAAGTHTADLGRYVDIGTAAQIVVDFSDRITPFCWGAIGNGIADDYTAFIAALDHSAAVNRLCHLEGASYVLGTNVYRETTDHIEGGGAYIYTPNTGVGLRWGKGATGWHDDLYIHDIKIRPQTFAAAPLAEHDGISFFRLRGSASVKNIDVQGFGNDGVVFESRVFGADVQNIYVKFCHGYGMGCDTHSSGIGRVNANTFTNIHILECVSGVRMSGNYANNWNNLRIESSISGWGTGRAIYEENCITNTINGGYIEWNYSSDHLIYIRFGVSGAINNMLINASNNTTAVSNSYIRLWKTKNQKLADCRLNTTKTYDAAIEISVDSFDTVIDNVRVETPTAFAELYESLGVGTEFTPTKWQVSTAGMQVRDGHRLEWASGNLNWNSAADGATFKIRSPDWASTGNLNIPGGGWTIDPLPTSGASEVTLVNDLANTKVIVYQ